MHRILHRTLVGLTVVAIVGAFLTPIESSDAAEVRKINGNYAGRLEVAVNKSEVLESDVPFDRVTVGNPEVADVLPLSDRTIYVLGKNVGQTNLAIFNKTGRPIAVVDILVTYDAQGLKEKLAELYPGERVEVRTTNNALVLSGLVAGSDTMSGIMAVANQYAPGSVANLMGLRGSQQVMLSVRFAEVDRSISRQLGINWQSVFGLGGDNAIGFLTGRDFVNEAAGALVFDETADGAFGSFSTGGTTVDVLIDFLESKSLMKTLAEPNLIALSGDTASFLAGGEFPVPVVQTIGESDEPVISVQFREFGVALSFTPTVLDNDLINLVVAPEVSVIDETVGVQTTGDISIPGLATRRARTTIEVRDGESFAIAGLIRDDFSDSVRQLPWIGDVPVLGALFRSSDFAKGQTELVIIVTAYLVQPAQLEQLVTPVDGFVEPTDLELFFGGRIEGETSMPGTHPLATGAMLSGDSRGGVAGQYGHIIE